MTTPTDPYSRPDENETGHDDFLDPIEENKPEGEYESVFHEDPTNDRRWDESEEFDAPSDEQFPTMTDGEIAKPAEDSIDHESWDREFGDQGHVDHEADANHTVAGDATIDSATSDDVHQDNTVVAEPARDGDTVIAQQADDETVVEPAGHGEAHEPAGDANHTVAGDAVMDGESLDATTSWTPNFDDDEPTEVAAQPTEVAAQPAHRDERGFSGFLPGDKTEEAEEPTVVETPAARPETPTRTSVFDRPTTDETTIAPVVAGAPRTSESAPTAPEYPVRDEQQVREDRPVRDENLFVPDAPSGRGWAHVGVFLATLVLAPFAWYLISDAGVRLGVLSDSQWATGSADSMSILELVGALICLGVLLYLAAFSSFGAQFFGLIIFVAGMIGVVAPSFAKDLLDSSAVQSFGDFNAFTGNVVYHLTNDVATGRLAVYGFFLLFAGIVAHWARRHGAQRGRIEGERSTLLRNR